VLHIRSARHNTAAVLRLGTGENNQVVFSKTVAWICAAAHLSFGSAIQMLFAANA